MKDRSINIAVIVNGGVNAGYKQQGTPSLMDLLNTIGARQKVTVYSLAKVEHRNGNFRIRSVHGRIGYIKVLKLLFLLTWDNLTAT
mgnify:CR=1 FL=1